MLAKRIGREADCFRLLCIAERASRALTMRNEYREGLTFLNRCDINKVAKFVHGNCSDSYCNRSETRPSVLLLQLY